MLRLRIEKRQVFADGAEAARAVDAIARQLAGVSRTGCCWGRHRDAVVPVDAGTLEELFESSRSGRASEAGRETHVISICGSKSDSAEIGVIAVNVRSVVAAEAAPGLVVSVALEAEYFETSEGALRQLAVACVDGAAADTLIAGPDSLRQELGAGWASFTKTALAEPLPTPAEVQRVRCGWLVFAHREDPGSETPTARAAVASVRAAMDAAATRGTAPLESQDPMVGAAAPGDAIDDHPSAGGRRPLAETSLPLDAPPSAVLPFVNRLAGAEGSPTAGRGLRAPAALSRTTDSVDHAFAPILPFGSAPNPTGLAESARVRPPPVEEQSRVSTSQRPPLAPQPPSSSGDRVDSRLARVRMPAPAALTGTVDASDGVTSRDIPFESSRADAEEAHSAGSSSGPLLTLEEYAVLRAQLTVRGEDHQETWKLFGITSLAAKEALQARFAARFRQDPASQQRFVELVRTVVGELRGQGSG